MTNETTAASNPIPWAIPWLSQNFVYSVIVVSGIATVTWVVRFIRYRQSYRRLVSYSSLTDERLLTFLQAPVLPAPPFNIFLGSLGAMAEIYANAPTDAHAQGIFTMMQRKYKLKGMWFLLLASCPTTTTCTCGSGKLFPRV
jgi:hypothetical protein